jgi:hypothetical protein|tara:strand:+ start:63 stop:230 length:168 start_codon:yes stop_codon:yes gene_type:complete
MKWSESLQGVTEPIGEGVFSSALRKFKSPILGGKRALFAYFFLKKKFFIGKLLNL